MSAFFFLLIHGDDDGGDGGWIYASAALKLTRACLQHDAASSLAKLGGLSPSCGKKRKWRRE